MNFQHLKSTFSTIYNNIHDIGFTDIYITRIQKGDTTMSIITPNIDSSPYIGVRNVQGKVRVKTHDDAPWLDNFFNGKENCDQITGITRGKTYDVISVEGFGDVEDITIIDDNGTKQTLGDFFFDEIE